MHGSRNVHAETHGAEGAEPSAAWYVPPWLNEAIALPSFEVIDTRSAQGRLHGRSKVVTIADLALFHGHVCDGLVRAAYALRALGDVAFPGAPFDRSDLLVVSKNSPCLGDVGAYLTGGRARFGTHRLDESLGVGFIVQIRSTRTTWEVREEAGFFPAIVSAWEAALLDDRLIAEGLLSADDKAALVAVNEAVQWDWLRTVLLQTRPADHYVVRASQDASLPQPLFDARRTDIVNRGLSGPAQFVSPYEPGWDMLGQRTAGDFNESMNSLPEAWRQRYLAGPPTRH